MKSLKSMDVSIRCRAVFGAIFTNDSSHRYIAPRFRETPQIFIAAE